MVRAIHYAALLAAIPVATTNLRAGNDSSFRVRTDLSKAPEAVVYADRAKALCLEWYPRINDLLFGPAYDLPYGEIVIVFEPQNIIGLTTGNTIHISSNWIGQHPTDYAYEGLVIHELSHVVQEYTNAALRHDRLLALIRPLRIKASQEYRMNWLAEGIADYVRWKCYRNDLEPRLRLSHGEYEKLRRKGYKRGYKTAASFLLWLEMRKDRGIIRKLDLDLRKRHYSRSVFALNCGAPLDKLWQEFIDQSRP